MEWKFTFSNPTYGTTVIAEPIGWADIAISIKRDLNVHGVFFDYAVGLKFIENGYAYLKNAYNTGGIDQYIELKVEVKCSDTDPFGDFYLGKLFLGKLVFDCTDVCFAECPVEPAGCLMKFRNRIDQKVDLQKCEDYDKNALACYNFLPYTIKMKPKLVKKLTTTTLNDYEACYTDGFTIPSGSGCANFSSAVYVEPSIYSVILNEVEDTNQLAGGFASANYLINNWIVAKYAGVYKVDIKINCTLIGFITTQGRDTCGCSNTTVFVDTGDVNQCLIDNGGIAFPASVGRMHDTLFEFILSVNDNPVYIQLLHQDSGACVINIKEDFCVQATSTLNLNAGDVVKAYFRLHATTSVDRQLTADNTLVFYYGYTQKQSSITCTDTRMNVQSEVYLPPTDSKVYMINEAFSRVTEYITNDCLRVKSNYFGRPDSQPYTSVTDGCGALESLTVGKHLRQFPDNLCLMNPSFKDLYESMNAIHNIGYGIEPDANRPGYEWLRIEPMEYWYNNTVLMTCDFIPEMKKRVMAEWYVSLFDFGFEKWEAEQTSGLDEFAVKKQYRTTFSEIKKTLSKRVEFIGSAYSIENTRAFKYADDSTKDWRWDNDIFVICVRRDGTATAPYSLISVEQGVDCINVGTAANIIDPPTIYNARISPNRNLLRWLPYLMANYAFDINNALSYFRFIDGQGNYLAEMELINGCLYEKAGVNLKENQDIDSGDTNTVPQAYPIYKFETVEFDYPMSFYEFNIIKANPRGVIEYRGRDMATMEKGFIYNIQYKPNEGTATFSLIPKYVP